MKTYEEIKGNYVIKFHVSEKDFKEILEQVRSLEGRRFNPETREWTCPATPRNKEILEFFKFEQLNKIDKVNKAPALPQIDTTKLPQGMFPYQIDAVRFMEAVNGKGLIADDQGLGKSLESLAYFSLHKELRPVLITCPAVMKLVWQEEVHKWLHEKAYVIDGTTSYQLPTNYQFYIINYDILYAWVQPLQELHCKGVIADESHKCANPEIIRTKAFIEIINNIDKKLFLSGTPIRGNPRNLFIPLHFIDKKQFPNYWKFIGRYMEHVPVRVRTKTGTKIIWKYEGSKNELELHNRIIPYILRRKKEDVLKELPPKQRIIVPLRISSKTYASYVEAEKEFLEWAETNRAKYLSENKYSELLRQLTYVGKRDQILSWIEDFMETDRKLVVFAYHKKVIDDIYSKFKSIAVVLSGDTPEKQRFEVQKQFQNNPDIKLFIGQIEAAGVGITLTSAADVAFVELLYTPDDLFQAEDRVHRIGQTKQVTIYYLVAADTIEEDVIEILDRKTKTISQIVEGEEKKFFGEHDFLQELLLQAKQRELS